MSIKIFRYALSLIAFVFWVACQSDERQQQNTELNQTTALTPEARLEQIKSDLKVVKSDLTKAGRYNCCVHPACDWCALHEGECTCHDNIRAGKAVCPDCGLGWHNGHGVVEGIKASEVKWNITHEHPAGGHKH